MKTAKNTICLWYNDDAEEAAPVLRQNVSRLVRRRSASPSRRFPSGKKGDVLTVEFTVVGISCVGLNGGSAFKHSEAFWSRSQPLTRRKRIATGTRSSITAARRAGAAGARTNGDCRGRSARSS